MKSFFEAVYHHAQNSGLQTIANYKGGDSYRFSLGVLDPNTEYDYDSALSLGELQKLAKSKFSTTDKLEYIELPFRHLEKETHKFCYSIYREYLKNQSNPIYHNVEVIFKAWTGAVNWLTCLRENVASLDDYELFLNYIVPQKEKYKKTKEDSYLSIPWDHSSWSQASMVPDIEGFLNLHSPRLNHALVLQTLYITPFDLVKAAYPVCRDIYAIFQKNKQNSRIKQIEQDLCRQSTEYRDYFYQKENIDNMTLVPSYKAVAIHKITIDFQTCLIRWGNTHLEVDNIKILSYPFWQHIKNHPLLREYGLQDITVLRPATEQKLAKEEVLLELSKNTKISVETITEMFQECLSLTPKNINKAALNNLDFGPLVNTVVEKKLLALLSPESTAALTYYSPKFKI